MNSPSYLPPGATVFGDKGYISDPDAASIFAANGVRLVSMRRKNMTPNTWADDYDLAHYRKRIETMNSQLEAMGIQHLHARTNEGFDLKAWASSACTRFHQHHRRLAIRVDSIFTGAGVFAPSSYRISALLEQLMGRMPVPIVLFYPGTWRGSLNYLGLRAKDEPLASYRVKIYGRET